MAHSSITLSQATRRMLLKEMAWKPWTYVVGIQIMGKYCTPNCLKIILQAMQLVLI